MGKKGKKDKMTEYIGLFWKILLAAGVVWGAYYWLFEHRVNVSTKLTSDFSLITTNEGKDSITADLYYRIIQESGGDVIFKKNKKLPLGKLNPNNTKSHQIQFRYDELSNPKQGVLFLEILVRAKSEFLPYCPYFSPQNNISFYYAELSQDSYHWRLVNDLDQVPGHRDFLIRERQKILKSIHSAEG